MNGKSHLVFGVASAIAVGTLVNPEVTLETTGMFVLGSAIGSLVPDVDTPKSIAGKILEPLSVTLEATIGHRTYTHDILLISILALLFAHKNIFLMGFFLGYILHLFLDAFTERGIPWFYLIHAKRDKSLIKRHIFKRTFSDGFIHLVPEGLRMKSGSFVSVAFVFLLSAAIIYIRFKILA